MEERIKELRLRSGNTRISIATLAGVTDKTLASAEAGKNVSEVTAYKILAALEKVCERKFELSDLDIKIR